MKRLIFLAVLLAGCANPFGPDVRIWGQRSMEPVPAAYAAWYAEVEACLGQAGDFGAVEWFVADRIVTSGVTRAGYWSGSRILLARRWSNTSFVVRHEAAHHILGVGAGGHLDDGSMPCEEGH